ncbi:DNA-formamidopyrimidine glycosylase family protein [Acidipropionibacterium jensenii]|uniref:DNA-formamidopyrimidine glycosylase family protein n=1 Tax=Acidipropionibacterium jensenii TaxID=1749 RepID=UPI0026476266|nr:DNA-formamidopyrimidine glycosylase family protein [Acidipropionibacterium jensenii]MDN6590979.1 Fpg/Nei family DNA glycosylase [Acidipropionibacterium jensenii]
MPEGDSVHRLAERLRPAAGRLVTGCQFRVPRLAVADLTGATLTAVRAHGKHLLMTLAPTAPAGRIAGMPTAGEWILHTHLRMEGTWRVHPAGQRWRAPGHTARVVLRLEGARPGGPQVELVGHDLGLVELWPADELASRLGWLGPDPLDEDWDRAGRWLPSGRDEAVRRAGMHPDRPIGVTLMDQSVLAGVGNEFRAEVCFLTGLDPRRPTGDTDLPTVIDRAATLMQANRHNRYRSSTGDNRPGHRSFVFGRNHQPCLRCGTLIRNGWLGPADLPDQERVIWWCPSCQR